MKRPAKRHVRAVVYALFFCVLLSFHSVAADCRGDESVLVPAWHNGRIGFIDATGNLILAPQFRSASRFSEGLARAKIDGDYRVPSGYIDRTGHFVISPKFISARDFSGGLARVTFGSKTVPGRYGKWGYINTKGELVIDDKFDDAEDFREGLARVVYAGKHGFIDKDGDFVINPIYEYAENFSDGLAVVAISMTLRERFPTSKVLDKYANVKSMVFGYVRKDGSFAITPQFGRASSFADGVAAVRPFRGPWQLIDKQGETIIELSEYSSIGRFSDGLAAVGVVSNRQTKFGFIDTTGKLVIVPQFDMVRRFSEGMAVIGEFDAQHRTHRKGFIDRTGSVVVQPTYLIVSDFEDGLAEVHVRGSERWSRKRGYINKTGNFVWDPAEPPTRSSNQAQEDTARKRADPQR